MSPVVAARAALLLVLLLPLLLPLLVVFVFFFNSFFASFDLFSSVWSLSLRSAPLRFVLFLWQPKY